MVLMGLQRLLTLGGFALVVCVGYLVLSIGLMMAAGLDPLHLSVGGVLMTFGATCVYALMTVACGFMLSEFGLSEEAANGFANIFGLLIMFTSGVALPIDMMPGVMVTIAKFLPGWWYCTAIDNAPASAGQTCSMASAWPPAASADPAPPWPRPPPRSWPSEKSAFQPIPLCRVVGELDSGDPPFLHQLAHTGCGGQRRQLQFAHDLLDAHGRMPLQYGHNRLDHVAR